MLGDVSLIGISLKASEVEHLFSSLDGSEYGSPHSVSHQSDAIITMSRGFWKIPPPTNRRKGVKEATSVVLRVSLTPWLGLRDPRA